MTRAGAFREAEASGVGAAGASTGAASTAPQAGSQQPLPAEQSGSSLSQQLLQQLERAFFALWHARSMSKIGVPQRFLQQALVPQQPLPASQAGSQQPLPASQAGSQQPLPASQAGSQQDFCLLLQ